MTHHRYAAISLTVFAALFTVGIWTQPVRKMLNYGSSTVAAVMVITLTACAAVLFASYAAHKRWKERLRLTLAITRVFSFAVRHAAKRIETPAWLALQLVFILGIVGNILELQWSLVLSTTLMWLVAARAIRRLLRDDPFQNTSNGEHRFKKEVQKEPTVTTAPMHNGSWRHPPK